MQQGDRQIFQKMPTKMRNNINCILHISGKIEYSPFQRKENWNIFVPLWNVAQSNPFFCAGDMMEVCIDGFDKKHYFCNRVGGAVSRYTPSSACTNSEIPIPFS